VATIDYAYAAGYVGAHGWLRVDDGRTVEVSDFIATAGGHADADDAPLIAALDGSPALERIGESEDAAPGVTWGTRGLVITEPFPVESGAVPVRQPDGSWKAERRRPDGSRVNRELRGLVGGLSIQAASGDEPDGWPTENPRGNSTSQVQQRGHGPWNVVRALSGARVRVARNVALSGGQSGPFSNHASLLYRWQDPGDALYALGLDPPPDFLFIGDTPADDGGISYADSLAYTIALWELLLEAYPDAYPIGATVQGVNIAGNAALRAAVNPGLRDYFASRGIRLIDLEAILTDQTTGLPPTGMTVGADSVHPNYAYNLKVYGRHLLRELAFMLPEGSPLVTDYLNDPRVQAAANGLAAAALFTGTGGFDVRAVLSRATIASGWNVDTAVAGGATALIPRLRYGYWQQVTLPSGLGSAVTTSVYRTGPGTPATAGVYRVEGELKFYGDLVNVTDFGLQLKDNTGLVYSTDPVVFGTNGGPAADPGAGVVLGIRTKPLVVPAGAGVTSLTASATVTAQAGKWAVGRLSIVREDA
jgi:hypothetical protein